jgi:hypothetical protein
MDSCDASLCWQCKRRHLVWIHIIPCSHPAARADDETEAADNDDEDAGMLVLVPVTVDPDYVVPYGIPCKDPCPGNVV